MCKNILDFFSQNKDPIEPKGNMVIDHDENLFPGDGSVLGPGYHPSQQKPAAKVYKKQPE